MQGDGELGQLTLCQMSWDLNFIGNLAQEHVCLERKKILMKLIAFETNNNIIY